MYLAITMSVSNMSCLVLVELQYRNELLVTSNVSGLVLGNVNGLMNCLSPVTRVL